MGIHTAVHYFGNIFGLKLFWKGYFSIYVVLLLQLIVQLHKHWATALRRRRFTVVGENSSEQGEQRVRPLMLLKILAHSCLRSLLNSNVSHNISTLWYVILWSSRIWRYFLLFLYKSFRSIWSNSCTHYHRMSSEQKFESVVFLLFKLCLFSLLLNNCSYVSTE